MHEIREKFPTKTIWLYTGYLWEQISHFEVMQYVDVCVDGEYEKDKRNVQLHWKGSSNQRVIDVPKSLETRKSLSVLRIVWTVSMFKKRT